jgi:hypothetical protein
MFRPDLRHGQHASADYICERARKPCGNQTTDGVRMSRTPDSRWDDIQRGRDPDSLYWERAREEAFQHTQREFRHEMDQRELDIRRRDRSIQDTADPASASPTGSPRKEILQCRKDILDRMRFSVRLDAHLSKDWISRLANLTDVSWEKELPELRRDVVREEEGWQRVNANNPWRREQYGVFLRNLSASLDLLELKCRTLARREQKA